MNLNNDILVSVYLLCYNHEKYISESIESVLNQTYKNIELIIVDNNSTDKSKVIIEKYVKIDNRIKFIPLDTNTFPSRGSNIAIENCKGTYISALSGDDYFVTTKIEEQLNYMLKNNLENTFTWVNEVDDLGNILNSNVSNLFNKNYTTKEIKTFFIKQKNVLCAITYMINRNYFEKYGFYDDRLLQSQDHDLWLRILKYEDINLYPKKLTNYRIRNDKKNLSVNMNQESMNRGLFESLYFGKHILDFELNLLSEVLENECTSLNKYKNLYEFYIQNEQNIFANAILFEMYNNLSPNIEFPSKEYNDFLFLYSNHDLFNFNKMQELISIVNKKDEQIIELNRLCKKYESKGLNYFFTKMKFYIKKLLNIRTNNE